MEIEQVDFVAAYLCSELDKMIYVEQPPGFKQEEWRNEKTRLIWKLKCGMYGLKQAGCQWQKKISRVLECHEFKKLSADENVLIHEEFLTDITVMLYVDDIKMICKSIEQILL